MLRTKKNRKNGILKSNKMKRYKSIVFTFPEKNSSDGNIRRTPRKYAKAETIQEFRPTLTSRTE